MEILWGDITQPDLVRKALEEVDAVVHMAAILGPLAREKPDLTTKVNVGGTRVIVDVIKEKGGHIPFVFTSTVGVFGATPDATEPISVEGNAPHPKWTYSETKFQAENVIKEAGVDYVILRLSTHLSELKRMFTIPLDTRIEFCHPDDTALAILNAIKNFDTVKGNTLIISNGPSGRMLHKEGVSAMLKVFGLPLPPLNKFGQGPFPLDWYDTSKAQELLHFQRNTFADALLCRPHLWEAYCAVPLTDSVLSESSIGLSMASFASVQLTANFDPEGSLLTTNIVHLC